MQCSTGKAPLAERTRLGEGLERRKALGITQNKNNKGLFKMASNKAALMECKQRYRSIRGRLAVIDKPALAIAFWLHTSSFR
jgi:hypothetical protein